MFGIGAQEMVVIGVLCLVIFGPGKLTQMARDLGRFVAQARTLIDEYKAELNLTEEPESEEYEEYGEDEIRNEDEDWDEESVAGWDQPFEGEPESGDIFEVFEETGEEYDGEQEDLVQERTHLAEEVS